MFCKNCGAELGDGSVFCNKCGANQQAQGVGQQHGTQPVMVVKQKIPGRGLGIASMVLGVLSLLFAFYVVNVACFEAEAVRRYGPDYAVNYAPLFLMFMVTPILSLFFGLGAFKQGYRNGVCNSGFIMGVIGLAGHVIALITLA